MSTVLVVYIAIYRIVAPYRDTCRIAKITTSLTSPLIVSYPAAFLLRQLRLSVPAGDGKPRPISGHPLQPRSDQ